jgi:thiosulfate reductase/polysulfide reductase chain A
LDFLFDFHAEFVRKEVDVDRLRSPIVSVRWMEGGDRRMARQSVWTMCGMCSVRCPIRVETEEGEVTWIEGNPHLLEGALFAKGSAGMALLRDEERPLSPMIRKGGRGAGRWEKATWPAAFDYVAGKLEPIIREHGPESIVVSCRGGPFVDLIQAFCHALGSPNFSNHHSACAHNVHHASLSVYGLGRKDFVYDLRNCRHLVLFGRNILASLRPAEAIQVMDMLEAGGTMTYVDVRQTLTGIKADRFFLVTPGTDYALALGMLHEVIRQGVYDKEFIDRYASDFDRLPAFVEPYTAEWAAKECGLKAKEIEEFVSEIGTQRPRVIFHPGWMLSRYRDSFYASRALHLLNVLMGNVEVEGGRIFAKGPGDCGVKGIRSLDTRVPKPAARSADAAGWKHRHFDEGQGLFPLFYAAALTGEPYPLKALICVRHDPLTCFPDPQAQKEALDKLDLLVSVDTHYSEFGWYSDVILPESTFLERDGIIATQKGDRPHFIKRNRVIDPMHDTRSLYGIIKGLTDRLGVGRYFPGHSIEEVWAWQLEPTGFTLKDFDAKGFVSLADKPVMFDRNRLDGKFKTPSGKIEIVSALLAESGIESLKPYESPERPPKEHFRLVFGRSPIHAHGHTINNPLLHELMPECTLWINKRQAANLGVGDGDLVEVAFAAAAAPSRRASPNSSTRRRSSWSTASDGRCRCRAGHIMPALRIIS